MTGRFGIGMLYVTAIAAPFDVFVLMVSATP
jgi:hypothetical protein